MVTSSVYRFLKIPFWDLFLTFVAHPRFSGLWGRPFWDLCSYQLSKRGWVRGPLLLSAFMGEVVTGPMGYPMGISMGYPMGYPMGYRRPAPGARRPGAGRGLWCRCDSFKHCYVFISPGWPLREVATISKCRALCKWLLSISHSGRPSRCLCWRCCPA